MVDRMKTIAAAVLLLATCSYSSAQCDMSAPGSRDASWSPDGSQVVYGSKATGNQEIYTMNPDGTGKTQLTQTQYPNYYPFFSPDGSRIVFMSIQNSITVIATINADGSELSFLTDHSSNNADPDWSPDGKHIIFYSDRDGNDELYIMNADGSNPRRLTNNSASDQTPSLSRDNKIVFVSARDGDAELYTMSLDGSDVTRITTDPRTDRVPRWAPDGESIVYYSREPTSVAGSSTNSWNGSEIYEIKSDGSGRTQLTSNFHLDQGPVISPDGSLILYTSCYSGQREVFVMDRDGGNARQLTITPDLRR